MTFKQLQHLKAQGAVEVSIKVSASFVLVQNEEKLNLFLEEEIQQGVKMRKSLFVEKREEKIFLDSNVFLKKIFFEGFEKPEEKRLLKYLLKDATVTLLQVMVAPGSKFVSLNGDEYKNEADKPAAYNSWYKVSLTAESEKLATQRQQIIEKRLIEY